MKEKCIHEDHRSRMRQRFHDSPDSLAKHELVELLLFYAIPRRNVNDEAHRLIDKYGSVSQILHADIDSLSDVEGIDRQRRGDVFVAHRQDYRHDKQRAGRKRRSFQFRKRENIFHRNTFQTHNRNSLRRISRQRRARTSEGNLHKRQYFGR